MTHLCVSRSGPYIVLDIKANAFLHHMVRNITGSLLLVGQGLKPVEWIAEVLAARIAIWPGRPPRPVASIWSTWITRPSLLCRSCRSARCGCPTRHRVRPVFSNCARKIVV